MPPHARLLLLLRLPGGAALRQTSARLAAASLLFFLPACRLGNAQISLTVLSEFQRVDVQGNILKQDRAANPREILSPLWARNGQVVYRVVVKAPPQEWFHFFIAQNPSNTVPARIYREISVERDGQLVPNRLIPVSHPFTGRIPDVDFPRSGQTVLPLLLVVDVPKDAEILRFRLELQLNVGDRWVIYPLEPRIGDVQYPPLASVPRLGISPGERADAGAVAALRQYVCGVKPVVETREDLTTHDLIYRGALQDMALAARLEARLGKNFLREKLGAMMGISVQEFCKGAAPKSPQGAEWYLAVRTYLYREAHDPEQPDP